MSNKELKEWLDHIKEKVHDKTFIQKMKKVSTINVKFEKQKQTNNENKTHSRQVSVAFL